MLSAQRGLPAPTTAFHNDTTVFTLHPRGSHCAAKGDCLRGGFLPYDMFPRTGSWHALGGRAAVYHLTYGCMQEEAPCSRAAVRPFRGHRQRLDRYEATDFDDQVSTLRQLGLWLVSDAAARAMQQLPGRALQNTGASPAHVPTELRSR